MICIDIVALTHALIIRPLDVFWRYKTLFKNTARPLGYSFASTRDLVFAARLTRVVKCWKWTGKAWDTPSPFKGTICQGRAREEQKTGVSRLDSAVRENGCSLEVFFALNSMVFWLMKLVFFWRKDFWIIWLKRQENVQDERLKKANTIFSWIVCEPSTTRGYPPWN